MHVRRHGALGCVGVLLLALLLLCAPLVLHTSAAAVSVTVFQFNHSVSMLLCAPLVLHTSAAAQAAGVQPVLDHGTRDDHGRHWMLHCLFRERSPALRVVACACRQGGNEHAQSSQRQCYTATQQGEPQTLKANPPQRATKDTATVPNSHTAVPHSRASRKL